MGLFIGASLLTILEILDYLCEVGGPGPQLGEGEAKWQPTPVFLPGKSYGQRSLVVYSRWGLKESDMT